jgi:hypothetical protein
MRWDDLFADLEAQAEAEERAAFEADVAELVRAEQARIGLLDRLRAHDGHVLALWLTDGERVAGRVGDVGADWVLVDDGDAVLIPLAAVTGVEGLGLRVAPAGDLGSRVSMTFVLRRLAARRLGVRVTVPGCELTGTIDRVGSDHFDLAVHPFDEPRRSTTVRGVRVVPTSAVVRIRPTR